MKLLCLQRSFDGADLAGQLDTLVSELAAQSPDAVLLPEMPVGPWLAGSDKPSFDAAQRSVAAHDELIAHLAGLGGTWFLTRPVLEQAGLINQAGVVRDGRFEPTHSKQIFPSEEGWSEAAWFTAGTPRFDVIDHLGVRFGFAICTEMMWPQIARAYLKHNVDVLLCPRATGGALDNWILAARMLSLVSGCYVVSSNHDAGPQFNGGAFCVRPGGLALQPTTAQHSVNLIEIDLAEVAIGRAAYPAYVEEPDLIFPPDLG